MEKFAKIFDLPERQVLITTSFDNEEGEYKIQSETRFNGNLISVSGTFSEESKCNEAFEKYGEDNAKAFLVYAEKLFS